jgi:hypothetical protein
VSDLPFASGGWSDTSRTFEAKFPGLCEDCGGGFEAGDEVRYQGDDLVHADPDGCEAMKPVTGAPCPECFMVHAGDCL